MRTKEEKADIYFYIKDSEQVIACPRCDYTHPQLFRLRRAYVMDALYGKSIKIGRWYLKPDQIKRPIALEQKAPGAVKVSNKTAIAVWHGELIGR